MNGQGKNYKITSLGRVLPERTLTGYATVRLSRLLNIFKTLISTKT